MAPTTRRTSAGATTTTAGVSTRASTGTTPRASKRASTGTLTRAATRTTPGSSTRTPARTPTRASTRTSTRASTASTKTKTAATARAVAKPKKSGKEDGLGDAQALQQHFDSLGIPEAEANFDVGLFMRKYFLDAAGRPDRAKLPLLLPYMPVICLAAGALPPRREEELRDAVRSVREVDGLALKDLSIDVDDGGGGGEGGKTFRALFLGWSEEAIARRAAQWEGQKRDEVVKEREKALLRQAQLKEVGADGEHAAYLRAPDADPGRRQFDIAGSYVVRCPSIEEQWDGPEGDMVLDVRPSARTPGVYEAWFRFRVLEGVMLLSADRALLVRHRNAVDRVRSREADWDWDYLRDEDAATTSTSATETTGKRKRKSYTASAQNPRRFWLMWNGRETGEGHLQADLNMNHTGCIEFLDDRLARLRGQMNLEFVGGDDRFEGRKVADAPAPARWDRCAWDRFYAATYKYI
ncbi:hypothetical protein DL766_000121 [Monosporascus sp. MC13-8B]|uniref:Fungal-type protein kinase domain-containing protein n=1 Tax=Monosporascus cannonballus TaxID=155416 RepID=A0ABY0GXT9_9PEZI|nr:hypothetical protein DL762_008192 [Monosporascus cannonballus]RYP40097.1 hypothetical protein DL766_000121 [Monosporascus sp. MC13-8B]